jgi:hypothetical protein
MLLIWVGYEIKKAHLSKPRHASAQNIAGLPIGQGMVVMDMGIACHGDKCKEIPD